MYISWEKHSKTVNLNNICDGNACLGQFSVMWKGNIYNIDIGTCDVSPITNIERAKQGECVYTGNSWYKHYIVTVPLAIILYIIINKTIIQSYDYIISIYSHKLLVYQLKFISKTVILP